MQAVARKAEAKGRVGRPRDEALTERRREEILDMAARVFADRGYPGTDVQEIADRLGVAKGTVYRYFPSKEELFLAAVDRGLGLLTRRLEECARDRSRNVFERASRGIVAYFAFFDESPHFVELLILERAEFKDRTATYFKHRDAAVGPWKALIRESVDSGVIRPIDVDRVTELFTNLLFGTLFTNHFTGRRASPDRQALDMIDLCLNGLLAPGAKAPTLS